jgi:hypothetical protein
MTTTFQLLVRIPVENSRTVANMDTYAQRHLDSNYTHRCYNGCFILSCRPLLKPDSLLMQNATCTTGHENMANAFLDIAVQFVGYKLPARTPLIGGRITCLPDTGVFALAEFHRTIDSFPIPIQIPLTISTFDSSTQLRVGAAVSCVTRTIQYGPMQTSIACTADVLQPQSGPVGTFTIDAESVAAAKALLSDVVSSFNTHKARLSDDSYRELCRAYVDSAWVKRDTVVRVNAATVVLDLTRDKPSTGHFFYYDAYDFSNIKLYSIPADTKELGASIAISKGAKNATIDAMALLLHIRENLTTMSLLAA